MPIKQRDTLTKSDFEEALNYLGETVSGFAKQTGIPRAYLSDLKNRNVPLARAQEDKLRTYLVAQGVEFDPAHSGEPANHSSPHARVQVAPIRYIAIRSDIDDKHVRLVFNEIERNDELIAELCEDEDVNDGDFDEQTQEKMHELFTRLAANYVLVRYLSSTENLLSTPPATSTLHKALLDSLYESEAIVCSEPDAPAAEDQENEPQPRPAPARKKSVLDEIL